ncbi:MAG: phenylalanine--tRNA ligase subunit beta [Candidatus Micrarchaeota archaeon]|nr:phenylalanine--tRNA ligase subunit beta [Candidatus Micrarchaeota archaeon]
MAQLQITLADLNELVAIGEQEAIDTLTMLGFPTEKTESGDLNVEVTPNRPDALSVEGIARALRCYLKGEPAAYSIGDSGVELTVDSSVTAVRPYFGGAVVKGITFNGSTVRSVMQLQEKLHETLGRKRRKVAIGIHDMDRVRPPFRYFACGREDVRFVPLESAESMTPLEILRRHPKGMAFEHLVADLCPMIEDSRHEILSFPPIINGELTKLTPETKNVFIDCTGTSEEAVRQAVNIVASALAERGGAIERITLNGVPYQLLVEKKWPLPVKESERLLGVPFTSEQVGPLLAKMGYRVEGGSAFSAGYRADVMNEVDLIEDVAIAYGFNNFEPSLPSVQTLGGQKPQTPYHELLVGLGFDEAVTWTLSNEALERKARVPQGDRMEIENPLTGDFTRFRASILPNLLSALAESKNEKLPIKLYEIGPVAAPSLFQSLSFASMHSKANFSEIKGAVMALVENTGKSAEVRAEEHGAFLSGRCAALYIDGNKIGYFGEIAPEVLAAFGLEQPVCGCEMSL